MLMFVTGVANIRDVVPFARPPTRRFKGGQKGTLA
jgi:aspartyl/asparaginyl-tRNA synthetase